MTPSIPRDWLRRRSSRATDVVIAGTVLAMAITADVWSGPRVSLLAAYVVVVIYAARFLDARLAIFVSLGAACGQFIAGRPWDFGLLGTPVPYWNAFVRVASYLAIVWVVRAHRTRFDERADRASQPADATRVPEPPRDDLRLSELEIREAEQRRIGRALHDGLSQQLTATMLASRTLEQRLVARSPVDAARAKLIAQWIGEAMGQVREVSHGLHPADLAEGGLRRALSRLAATTQLASGIPCRFVGRGPGGECDISVATHLYRIAQEAVNNAVRHAKPERIVIALSDSHGWLGLTILDNGVGCTTPAPGAEGLGLRTMRERASALAGRLEIRRNPRGGTRVVCAVPSAVAVQSDEARARMNALPVVAAP